MTDCEKIEKLLWEHPDGTISGTEKAELESHLAVCTKCRKAHRTISLLRESSQSDQVAFSSGGEAFDAAVMRKIRERTVLVRTESAPSRQYVFRMAFSFAVAAAVVLFIVRSISDVDNIVIPMQKTQEAPPESKKDHALIHLEYGTPKPTMAERRALSAETQVKVKGEQVFSILPSPVTAPSPDSVNIAAVYLSADSIPLNVQTTSAASLADVLADTALAQAVHPSIGELVTVEKMPEAVYMARPEYPVWAKKQGLSAVVWIKARVGSDGGVSDAEVVSCSLPGSGFEEAALAAARQSKYRPAMANGITFPVWVIYPVKFIYRK